MLVIKCINAKSGETVPDCRKRLDCKNHCGDCALMKVTSEK